jgi:exopolysaccharide biosynthesis polyprenyl glycosylphosphotransferase
MLKKRQEQVGFLVKILDLLICISSFFLAYKIRGSFLFGHLKPMGPLDTLSWFLMASLAFHFVSYPMMGLYASIRLKSYFNLIRTILGAALMEFFFLGALVFIFQEKATSRYFFGLFLGLNYSLLLVSRIGAKVLLSSIRARGYNYRRVLIVGTGKNAEKIVGLFQLNKHWGYLPFAVLTEKPSDDTKSVLGVPVKGIITDLHEFVTRNTVDEVYFAGDKIDPSKIEDQVLLCESLGIPARLPLTMFQLNQSKVTFHNIEGVPIITFYTTLKTPIEALIKRLMDVVIALIGLGIAAVFYPWIAYRIRKESNGPIIFKQMRVGENGRTFKCYKFRTMVLDAESKKKELEEKNLMGGPLFKIKNDPRVFPFGAFLRRTSLDELPQFLNILRGDMSVVGTRPPTPDEVEKYKTYYRRRLSIRPGLTGLWQVSGRNRITNFEDVLALDLQYIDEWSLWLDLKIIFKTIGVALFGKGAH